MIKSGVDGVDSRIELVSIQAQLYIVGLLKSLQSANWIGGLRDLGALRYSLLPVILRLISILLWFSSM